MPDKPAFSSFAPASIGNFIAGFDVLGMAIAPLENQPLGDQVTVTAGHENQLAVTGAYRDWVPAGNDNLVYQAALLVQQWLSDNEHPSPLFSLTLEKGLPVGSGTGSSAASAVAAIKALGGYLSQQHDIQIPDQDRWQMLADLEGQVSGGRHLDNLAPSVLGGLVYCPEDGPPRQLPFFDDWYVVLAYNGQKILTRDARACLPASYDKAVTIRQMQRMTAVIDGLYRQDRQQVLANLDDELAEPYRASLIEGYAECKQGLLERGALAVGISGAGPSFFAISDDLDKARLLADWLRENLTMLQGSFVHVCRAWYP